MIKSIIKRIIVGVGIALVLSFIYNIKPKADVIQMTTLSTGKYYRNSTDLGGNVSSVSYGNVNYWSISQNGISSFDGLFLALRGLHSSNYYNIKNGEYVSFIVHSNDVIPTGAYSTNTGITCSNISNGQITDNSSYVTDNILGSYWAVIECNTSGAIGNGTYDFNIYFNSSIADNSITTLVSKNFYFYNSPIGDKLNTLITLLGTTNTDLNSLITLMTSNNTYLSNIYNLIDTKLTALQNNQSAINGAINNASSSIQNKQQDTTDAIKDMNDTIKNDNVDNPTDYSSNVASNGVITQLITLPITLYTKILNSTSSSCSPFSLGTLFDTEIIIPCINLSNYLGSTLYNVIDILISGLFIYSISRKMVKVFNNLSSMKEGDVING